MQSHVSLQDRGRGRPDTPREGHVKRSRDISRLEGEGSPELGMLAAAQLQEGEREGFSLGASSFLRR